MPTHAKPSSPRCKRGSRRCQPPSCAARCFSSAYRSTGLLILRDGGSGEPEVTLSPQLYHYQHRAEIDAVVQGGDRNVASDTLTSSIGATLAADRTLGGLCDWFEADAPRSVDLSIEGAASLKAAVIPAILHYTTANPLA